MEIKQRTYSVTTANYGNLLDLKIVRILIVINSGT